jgi:hypothetical protein
MKQDHKRKALHLALHTPHRGKSDVQHRTEYDAFKARGAKEKSWHTDPTIQNCEQCLANEKEGRIEINIAFPSGHQYPNAHPNCQCHAHYFGYD